LTIRTLRHSRGALPVIGLMQIGRHAFPSLTSTNTR